MPRTSLALGGHLAGDSDSVVFHDFTHLDLAAHLVDGLVVESHGVDTSRAAVAGAELIGDAHEEVHPCVEAMVVKRVPAVADTVGGIFDIEVDGLAETDAHHQTCSDKQRACGTGERAVIADTDDEAEVDGTVIARRM